MPHFLPVQCHKCSVLQIKPAQTVRPKWCCSMCRKPEIKVGTAPGSHHVSDVSLFVEELNLPQEAEEMEVVGNTFGGVESLDGVFCWEGLYFKAAKTQEEEKWKRFTGIETCEADFANGGDGGEDVCKVKRSNIALKQDGSQHGQFLSSLWRRWHQKPEEKDVVELREFAQGEGQEEYGSSYP
ncbi:hypothetical protein M758_4G159700 [Ceratodon purpureus]|nr:hypothetical protein M758_4G159700 [Ceratodon purpureus]